MSYSNTTSLTRAHINEVDTHVQGDLHHTRCLLLAEVAHVHPASELHRAKRHSAHDESSIPQSPVSHLHPPSAGNKNRDTDCQFALTVAAIISWYRRCFRHQVLLRR